MQELKSLLLAYEIETKDQEINTYLFLAILGLFSGEYRLALFFVRKLESLPLQQEQMRLAMEIRYSIRKLDKIIILTSFEKATPLQSLQNFKSEAIKEKIFRESWDGLVIQNVTKFTETDLKSYFQKYEQVFIIGHGNSIGIEIGDRIIGLGDIVPTIQNVMNKPNVLGIFSCGDAFNKEEIWNNVDYFVTDTFFSAPLYAEMFLYGYIPSYYRNRDVLKAFDAGWILPAINAISDPSFTMREKGYPIRP